MSSRIDELDAIVRQFDLNEHPFYTEWRAGTLPIERLAEYARRVGALHRRRRSWAGTGSGSPTMPPKSASTTQLWSRFRGALGATGEMRTPAVDARLLAVGENAFASVPESLGALYSFEVQQPATASSKLAGLREHYAGTVDADAQQLLRRARGRDR